LEREQKRRRETEKKKRNRSSSIKAEHSRDIIAIVIIALSLAEKIRDFSVAGTDRAYSNKRSRRNKYSHGKPKLMDRICAKV